jgi:hypothetical protein
VMSSSTGALVVHRFHHIHNMQTFVLSFLGVSGSSTSLSPSRRMSW